MKRRSFLGLIGAAIVAPSMIEESRYKWRCDYRPDWYADQLYCCYTHPNGKKYHVVHFIQPGANRRPAIEAIKKRLKRIAA